MQKKIVDCFLYHNEAELMELRIRSLQHCVDEFVICEANRTHSGVKKPFSARKLTEQLGLPTHKITVIEVDIPPEHLIEVSDLDRFHAQFSQTPEHAACWTRERLQRDAVLQRLDRYDANTVFIMSDCDEIIRADVVHYVTDMALKHPEHVIKIPLVMLQSRADQRMYHNHTPVEWKENMYLATVQHLTAASPTVLKTEHSSPFPTTFITEDGVAVKDLGWHFTWMGDHHRKLTKKNSFIHHAKPEVANTASQQTLEELGHSDYRGYTVKPYDINDLPQEIFQHKHIEQFLLGDRADSVTHSSTVQFAINKDEPGTAWIVDNFYQDPDAVRQFALAQQYDQGGIGRGYIGNRTSQQFLFPGLRERFEEIIGRPIVRWQEHGMNGRFQHCAAGSPLVYHCDSQRWAGMLYLTPDAPFCCGTTLLAHRVTRARTYMDEGWDAAWKDVPGDCHLDGTSFEPVDVLGNVYNRLVIFDARCIHSASGYFGTVTENCRLWQMFFFD